MDAYEAYQAGELGAEEIVNLGLAATGTVLSTGAAIGSARGLYKLMGSDGVGCKAVTGITGEPHCFVAGTLVSTEDGQRAIEEVETGDKVWAYDEETGEKALKEVEEVFVSETDKLVHVGTDREEIVTTELHPFYVEGLGFVQAGCLQEGYELRCLDGSKETITGIRVEWLEEPAEVYNFEVADYHTYYVGDGDVLVHNKCANPSGSDGKEVPGKDSKITFRAGDLYENSINVNGIQIDALAEIEIEGNRLILRDLAIYSNQGDIPNQIGVSEFKKWLKAIKEDAGNQGFKELQIIGQRVQHSTSANPGSIINRVFKLKSKS